MNNYWPFKSKIINLAFFTIIISGVFWRFYGLDWDQGHHLHPDERMITIVAERIHLPQPFNLGSLTSPESPINPKFFAYGSLPIYLLKALGSVFAYFDPEWAQYSLLNLLGRSVSALADTAVILLVYLLGKQIWSKQTGLLAASFYSLAVFPIQAAHFYAVDSLLNLFILTTLYCLVLLYEKPSAKNAFWVGLFFGLSLATKVSATVLILAVGLTLTLDLFLIFIKRVRQIRLVPKIHQEFFQFFLWLFDAFKTPKRARLLTLVAAVCKYGGIIGFTTLIVFLIIEPYAVIDFDTFWRQTQEQHQMTRSAFTFPYTLQYVGTTPYLYHLKNLLWGMGLPLGGFSVMASFCFGIYLLLKIPQKGRENQEAKMLILFFFFLIYFAIVGRFAIKFMRYLLPLYPLLTLFTAWFFQSLINRQKGAVAQIAKISLAAVLVTTLLWTVAFTSIYHRPNTRVKATNWAKQTIPQGSKIAVEHWDDRVPLNGNYQFLEMPMYETDSSRQKWQVIEKNLKEADYLILASNRLYTPLQKLTDCQKYKTCYTKTAHYYQNLFAGKLQFEETARFTSYPKLEIGSWKLEINDEGADESFTVYDHPKVIIFKKSI